MNGAGNDFVIFNNEIEKKSEEEMSEITKIICERHNSIGADGTMWVDKSDIADYKMTFFNADGTKGEMCGNGARCICRYGYENQLAGDIQKVETTAGIVIGQRIDSRLYRIRINDPSVLDMNLKTEIDGVVYSTPYVEIGFPGLPHTVVEIPGLRNYPKDKLFDLGRKLRYHSNFPKGANVNFYDIEDDNQIYEMTYERGVEDFTYACGTGTSSMVMVNKFAGRVSGEKTVVEMPGGELVVDVKMQPDDVGRKEIDMRKAHEIGLFLTGLTNIVAKGTVTDENL